MIVFVFILYLFIYLCIYFANSDGVPYRKSTALVMINIADVNDESPKFLSSNYVGAISENSDVGSKILQVCILPCR